MNEISRLAYLDALGVESYVSRHQLPGARPIQRLRLVAPKKVAPVETVPEPATNLRDIVADAPTQASVRPAGESVAPIRKKSPAAEIPVFSVQASLLGQCLWLDAVPPGRELGAEYMQLLHAICHALGLEQGEAVSDRFNWPMQPRGQLDQGEEAARAAFSGFLVRRLEQMRPRRVILLGEAEKPRIDDALFGDLPVHRTVSAWQMLRQGALKAQAWQDLKGLKQG